MEEPFARIASRTTIPERGRAKRLQVDQAVAGSACLRALVQRTQGIMARGQKLVPQPFALQPEPDFQSKSGQLGLDRLEFRGRTGFFSGMKLEFDSGPVVAFDLVKPGKFRAGWKGRQARAALTAVGLVFSVRCQERISKGDTLRSAPAQQETRPSLCSLSTAHI